MSLELLLLQAITEVHQLRNWDGNRLAHSLTRYFINVSSYVVWMEGVPDPLFTVVQQDVANLAN